MTSPPEQTGPPSAVARVVGPAIQDLAAARLGRAFVPLALLFLVGLGQLLRAGQGLALAVGAPACAAAMLAHGLRLVQRAFGRPPRPWMAWASLGGVLPPALGVYVLGWLGLRALAGWEGLAPVSAGALFTALGLWLLWSWVRLLELHRLALAMAAGVSGGRGREEGA